MYHDVTPRGREDASGFAGRDAARYKLTPDQFDRHLAAIGSAVGTPPLFTFDDGGVSAGAIAEALERCGWRGWFFVTTSRLDRPGFLTPSAVRRLHAAGHRIGSHSHTHPLRMARCPKARLIEEWQRSVAILSDLIGEQVTSASVPGGEYGDEVARAAAQARIRILFTSEPTLARRRVDEVEVRGRFPILASTDAAAVAALAAGQLLPRVLWAARWQARRAAKRAFGDTYLRFRAGWLGASKDAGWGDDLSSASEDSA
jgi:peptidoglycan/xylan/chitin deacetylase (PgdA/CDA1 family)